MSVQINGTNGLTFNDGSSQQTAASGFGFKNRIINGAMMIDQRNAGASITPANGGYTVDRWVYLSSQASKFTVQQNAGSVTPPAGFTNYLGMTVASSVSVGAGDYFGIAQIVEGLNVADLGWGTPNARTVTLSCQVYSSLTGTFGGSITNSGSTRSYPFTYTIAAANTWTTIQITIPGDTAGTWLKTNGNGMTILFALGVGSTYSGTAGSWAGTNYISATGATSVVGTNGATFYITGVQLEKGSTATSFDYRPYGTELALCQRYYEKSYDIGTVPGTTTTAGQAWGARLNGAFACPARFAVSKRATPTITSYSSATGNSGKIGNADSGSDENASISDQGTSAFNNGGTTATISTAMRYQWTASAEL